MSGSEPGQGVQVQRDPTPRPPPRTCHVLITKAQEPPLYLLPYTFPHSILSSALGVATVLHLEEHGKARRGRDLS